MRRPALAFLLLAFASNLGCDKPDPAPTADPKAGTTAPPQIKSNPAKKGTKKPKEIAPRENADN